MPDAQDVYVANVRPLLPAERLRAAALILDELTWATPPSVLTPKTFILPMSAHSRPPSGCAWRRSSWMN